MSAKKVDYKRLRKKPAKLDVSFGLEPVRISPIGSRYVTDIAEIFGESGYLDALLKAEASSTSAISDLYPDKIPKEDAATIEAAANTKQVKLDKVQKTEAEETHHEMGAVIKEFAKSAGKSGRYVHYTLTSADAVETAKAVQLKKGLEKLIDTVARLRDTNLTAAKEWKDVPAIMRTHGQHAIPASFGMPFAFFGYCLHKSVVRLRYDLENFVEGKVSGAIGTYDVSTDEGMDGFLIEKEALKKLKIKPSEISMQVPARENIAYIISDLAILCGRVENIASYIKLLKRTEILELKEEQDEGVVSSSAMPHKNLYGNPYIEERCISIAKVVRGFAATAMESVSSEDFRDLTASLSDRVIIPESFVLADYSCGLMENVINRVDIIPENIDRNLNMTKGTVTSQRVMSRLIKSGLSRDEARRRVREAAERTYKENGKYLDALLQDPTISKLLSKKEIMELSDPNTYLGKSAEIIDIIVDKYTGK